MVQGPNGDRGERHMEIDRAAPQRLRRKGKNKYVSTAWILVSLVCSLVKQRPATCLQFGTQLFQLGLQAGS